MKSSSHIQEKVYRVLSVMALMTILLAACGGGSTQNGTPTPTNENWRLKIPQVPLPQKGCFEATYPNLQWRLVSCTTAPSYPQPPRNGPRPNVIGNNNDVSTQVSTGFISTAIGSFDSVSGVTSESGPINNTGPSVANAYTLQLNTDFLTYSFPFSTGTPCAGSPNSMCSGWEQFVFENDGSSGRAYIQYWLIRYNATCPAGAGWNQFSFTGSTDIYCWKNNSRGAVSVPAQSIANLGQLSLSGTVSASGDSVTLSTASTAYSVAGDNAVNAAAGWQTAEFNVFGDGGGGQASFNSGAAVVPRTRVLYGGRAAPGCVAQGFTGETNNLSFGPSAPVISPPGPALAFTESSAGGSATSCAAASEIGDTHLQTFSGLFYDFQATGDFLLAQTEDFLVQTRKVSGAPTWPNASINREVATQMGNTRVALCTTEAPLVVDGTPTGLASGQTISLPSGVNVFRTGNVYLVTDQSGNSMRAVLNGTWIDVSVGLGAWPTQVRGLLANANGNVNELETSDGTVLNIPVSFNDLYHRYGESWRVAPADSLLSADCKNKAIENGIPTKPFFARDLPSEIYNRARSICTSVGVKDPALLDACTLDVAVLGNAKAAAVYVGLPTPVAIGETGQTNSP